MEIKPCEKKTLGYMLNQGFYYAFESDPIDTDILIFCINYMNAYGMISYDAYLRIMKIIGEKYSWEYCECWKNRVFEIMRHDLYVMEHFLTDSIEEMCLSAWREKMDLRFVIYNMAITNKKIADRLLIHQSWIYYFYRKEEESYSLYRQRVYDNDDIFWNYMDGELISECMQGMLFATDDILVYKYYNSLSWGKLDLTTGEKEICFRPCDKGSDECREMIGTFDYRDDKFYCDSCKRCDGIVNGTLLEFENATPMRGKVLYDMKYDKYVIQWFERDEMFFEYVVCEEFNIDPEEYVYYEKTE